MQLKRIGAWLLALAAPAMACRTAQTREPTWLSDGGELGARVQAGALKGVRHARFWSNTLQREVGTLIVTPPGYDAAAERRYPVVYLFPGLGGDEWKYLREAGLENAAIKRLFAEPARAPLLVFGNPGDSGAHQRAAVVLGEELVHFVDQNYRTRAQPGSRSLEGFSLGGVAALTLLLQRPDVFGRAVALSSGCYLLSSCAAQRAALVGGARQHPHADVLLAIGAREAPMNRAIGEELAPLLSTQLVVVPDADHDWASQLANREFAQRIADFHLAGFAKSGD
jgi:predicted esterase